jgi:hypothetical protein
MEDISDHGFQLTMKVHGVVDGCEFDTPELSLAFQAQKT